MTSRRPPSAVRRPPGGLHGWWLFALALTLAAPLIPGAQSPSPVAASEVRVKDLARIQGVRENELFGYGLV
ncbi:MAG TPA: hypothetical protein VEU07_03500, partial [Candidatus Acidoferrum sp.]|nr:hypothetical protein [Candidatus Acidoferrum sp.]